MPKDRKQYEESLKEYRDYYNTIETAEKKGEIPGEKKKSIEIAKKLLNRGVSMELIAEDTGLSLAEIKKNQQEEGLIG